MNRKNRPLYLSSSFTLQSIAAQTSYERSATQRQSGGSLDARRGDLPIQPPEYKYVRVPRRGPLSAGARLASAKASAETGERTSRRARGVRWAFAAAAVQMLQSLAQTGGKLDVCVLRRNKASDHLFGGSQNRPGERGQARSVVSYAGWLP